MPTSEEIHETEKPIESAGAVTSTPLSIELTHTPLTDAQRLRHLFESAPVALFEEDFTRVVTRLAGLAADEVENLDRFLRENPEKLFELAILIQVVDVNSAAARIVGVEDPQLLRGPLLVDTFNQGAMDSLRGQIVAIWEGKTAWSSTFEGSDVFGRAVPVSLSLHVPIADDRPDFGHVMVSMTDVSEIVAAQRELERVIRWKDEFTASVAHELRTPVTGIIGLSQILAGANGLSPDEVSELTTLLANEASELERLVEDLLVAGRSGAGQLDIRTAAFDVRAAIADVVRLVDPSTVVDGESVTALGDGVRVRQIVRNLLTNALRYGGPRRRISIDTVASTVLIDVMDNGDAIPHEDESRIFEAFNRSGAKTVAASVGLGLAVSQTLARAQNGDLEYLRIGDWNAFRLSLPAD